MDYMDLNELIVYYDLYLKRNLTEREQRVAENTLRELQGKKRMIDYINSLCE